MRLVVAGADRALAVDRLDAVPDLQYPRRWLVGPQCAGDYIAIPRRNTSDLGAMRAIAFEQEGRGRLRPDHRRQRMPARTAAQLEQPAEIGLGFGRFPLPGLRDRRLNQSQ